MKRSEIFLGDLIEVIHHFGARKNEAAIARIGGALGFGTAPVDRAKQLLPPPLFPAPVHEKAEPKPEPVQRDVKAPKPLTPTRTEAASGVPPRWLEDQVTPFPKETLADFSFILPYEPLFAPKQIRGIITTALATRSAVGDIDEEQLVAARARRQPITVVPRRTVPSLRGGVLVLLDRRDVMMPFFTDQNHLVDTVRNIAGHERVDVRQFLHRPSQVLSSDRRWKVAFRPPLPGTTILMVTDLGIGVPPLSTDNLPDEEWLKIAETANRSTCPMVALVPYPADRWPRYLARKIITLPWDRETNAGLVRRRVGPGLVASS